jgi:hypothetical protein
MNTKLKIKQSIPQLIATALLLIGVTSCATAKKSDAPVERAPEGNLPHVPELKNAEVQVLWVPEKIEQDRWEEGHYLYVIKKPSTWKVQ